MGRKLTRFVHVDGTAYGPDDEVPREVAARITNPDVWDGEGETEPGDDGDPEEPPRSGVGSGLEAWTKYATSLGLTVRGDAKRDDVIALVDESKK